MIKKIFKFFIIFVFIFNLVCFSNADDKFFEDTGFGDFDFLKESSQNKFFLFETWQCWQTFYFDIHYYNEECVQDIIQQIDAVYLMIMEDFGWLNFSVPLRVSVYIYKTPEEYVVKTGMPAWSGGHADLKKRSITTYEGDNLFQRVIVHELTHFIFDAYMGYPRRMAINWLHEGVAVYEEKRILGYQWNMKKLKELNKRGQLYSVDDLLKMRLGRKQSNESVSLWYFCVGTLIAFMRTLDPEGFRVFTTNLKSYNNVNESLKMTYPWHFHNVESFDKAWKKWIDEQADVM